MKLPATLQALLDAPLEQEPVPPLYPCSDRALMADNSRQLHWIVLLYSNLCWLFQGRQDVAVHANMIWYPEEGDPKERQAPDVFVVFGRPPKERDSYLQWEEEQIPLTVVFEILSPSNTAQEMRKKQEFYDHYGVEEYYEYDPKDNTLMGFYRQGEVWVRIRNFNTWVSKRLGIRFVLTEDGMSVEGPSGDPFVTFEVIGQRWLQERQRADDEKRRADSAEQLVRRLAELSRKARRGLTTEQELLELEQLESDADG